MTKKERFIEAVVDIEWIQFQQVHNEGGRASCQDDRETFEIMRKSQFLAWTEEVLESYLQDLRDAWKEGWNLLTEKYARMMESTAPEEYERFREILPKRSGKRIRIAGRGDQPGNYWWAEDFFQAVFRILEEPEERFIPLRYAVGHLAGDVFEGRDQYIFGSDDRSVRRNDQGDGGTGRKSDGANSRIYGTFLWIRFSGNRQKRRQRKTGIYDKKSKGQKGDRIEC